jgi:hypothetical protein
MVRDPFVIREVGVQQHQKAERRAVDSIGRVRSFGRTTLRKQIAHKILGTLF